MGGRQAVTRRRNVGLVARFALLALFVAVVAAFAPAQASAQFFDPELSGNEKCATSGPNGYPRSDPWSRLSLRMEGSGVIDARMHDMPAGSDCIRGVGEGPTFGTPDRCDPKCELEVMSVCEVHCGVHQHSPPFDWTVRLTATPAGGLHLVGWRAQCAPVRNAPSRDCVVQMDAATPQTAIAVFRGVPDTISPAPAPVVRATALGGYTIEITWDPSADQWLAGYDVYVDGELRSRVGASATRKVRLTAKCARGYGVEVAAFDFSGNTVRSAATNVRTDACTTSGGPAPADSGPRPNTALHVKPARTTKSRTAFFHFGVRGDIKATRGFQCKLDRGRWARCNASTGKRYRNLKKGYHTFRVRAGNAVGFDVTPATWRWRIR